MPGENRAFLFLAVKLFFERQRQPGLLAVGGGASDGTDLNGLVVGRMDSGEEFGGLVQLFGRYRRAEHLFHAAQVGLNPAVLKFFAGAIAHPAFG